MPTFENVEYHLRHGECSADHPDDTCIIERLCQPILLIARDAYGEVIAQHTILPAEECTLSLVGTGETHLHPILPVGPAQPPTHHRLALSRVGNWRPKAGFLVACEFGGSCEIDFVGDSSAQDVLAEFAALEDLALLAVVDPEVQSFPCHGLD